MLGVRNGKPAELALPAATTNCVLTRIFESRDGEFWIGTETNGLARIKGGRPSFFTTKEGLAYNSIRSLCEDEKGGIWIATAGGLSHWDGTTFTNLTSQNGLLHNFVRVVYFDREGTIVLKIR